MNELGEIDERIRSLTGESILSRPFVCQGSPIGCEIAEVGINPGTDTPFWPYWDTTTGFDKQAWLTEYVQRHGRLMPTRDRIEVLNHALAPHRCLELNLFHRYSDNEAALAKDERNTDLFDYLLHIVKPRILLVHGNSPIQHLQRLLGANLTKDQLCSMSYQGLKLDVFVSKKHFAYVSRDYVRSVAKRLADRLEQ